MLILPSKVKERFESDFGRIYGWNMVLDGGIVGELEYIRWDSNAQFWHDYNLINNKLSFPNDSLDKYHDAWKAIILVNKKYNECRISDYIPCPRVNQIVGMRCLRVPDKYFIGIKWSFNELPHLYL